MACQRGRSALWVMVVGGAGTPQTAEMSALQPLFGAPFVLDNILMRVPCSQKRQEDQEITHGSERTGF